MTKKEETDMKFGIKYTLAVYGIGILTGVFLALVGTA